MFIFYEFRLFYR